MTGNRTRKEEIDTYETAPALDTFQLRGQLAEATVFDGKSRVMSRTWNGFWLHRTVDVPEADHSGTTAQNDSWWQTRDAYMVRVDQTRVLEVGPDNTETPRKSTTTTTFFPDSDPLNIRNGMVSKVAHEGVAGADPTEHCTYTDYRWSSAAWIAVVRTRKEFSGLDCATGELTRSNFFYDGQPATNLSVADDATLTKGDLTQTNSNAVLGASPVVVTTKATYDVYGRIRTQTEANGNTTDTGYAPLAAAAPSTGRSRRCLRWIRAPRPRSG